MIIYVLEDFMIIFSIKKIEERIKNRLITSKQFIIYSFFTLGSFFSLIKISRLPVNIDAYNMAYNLLFIPVVIDIIKYICCYKIIKGKDIFEYLYAIIPLNFVLNLRYSIFIMLPLILASQYLIKYYNLDKNYWIVVSSAIISVIFHLFVSIHLIFIVKRLYKNSIFSYGEMLKSNCAK
jgi:hypothetical protein